MTGMTDRTSPETETFLPEQITGEIACILENCSGPEHQSEEALAFLMQSYQSTWEQLREVILRGLAPSSGLATRPEIQSGMDRQKWAENLILQLPIEHNGRNSWLLNYGRGEFAQTLRKDRQLLFNEQSQAVNPPASPDTSTDRISDREGK
jgi:hypothetical protein